MLSISAKKASDEKRTPELHIKALSTLFQSGQRNIVRRSDPITVDRREYTLPQTVIKVPRNLKKGGHKLIWLSNSPLGEGKYGTVFPIDHIHNSNYQEAGFKFSTKDKVVKVVRLNEYNSREPTQAIMNEISFMSKAGGFNVKAPVFIGDECYIVMDRIHGEDLLSLLNNKTISKLSKEKRYELIWKLLNAFNDQVTSKDIIHRDIKPENIMVSINPEIEVKIIDFGFAIAKGQNDRRLCGTDWYAAPEFFKFPISEPSSKTDLFGLARIILVLVLAGEDPFLPPKHNFFKFKLDSAVFDLNRRDNIRLGDCSIF